MDARFEGPCPHTQRREARRPSRLSQRRSRNKPGHGAAEPVVAGPADEQPPLGFDAHELVADMWSALGRSVEGRSLGGGLAAGALELWFSRSCDDHVRCRPGSKWSAVQRGLDEC